MATEKTVTTRKEHICGCCSSKIEKGTKAYFVKSRFPRFDDANIQIGISYVSAYYHDDYSICQYNNSEPITH